MASANDRQGLALGRLGEPLDGLDVVDVVRRRPTRGPANWIADGAPAGWTGRREHRRADRRAIWLKNVAELVAVPRSRKSTEFWMAVTIVYMMKPRPALNRNSYAATCQYGVPAVKAAA